MTLRRFSRLVLVAVLLVAACAVVCSCSPSREQLVEWRDEIRAEIRPELDDLTARVDMLASLLGELQARNSRAAEHVAAAIAALQRYIERQQDEPH